MHWEAQAANTHVYTSFDAHAVAASGCTVLATCSISATDTVPTCKVLSTNHAPGIRHLFVARFYV